jgi:Tol biopolymer transport system component
MIAYSVSWGSDSPTTPASIFVMSSNGGSAMKIGAGSVVAWEQRGLIVDTACCVGNRYGLFSPSGAQLRRLPAISGVIDPSFLGRKVAFSGGTDLAPAGIFTMNMDGSDRVRVAGDTYANPSWSPDGRTLSVVDCSSTRGSAR